MQMIGVGKYNFFGRNPAMLNPFIHHHLWPNSSLHNHPSLSGKGWVKMGRTNEFWLMSSEENNKLLTNVDKSPVCKCRWLELENTHIVLGEIQRCSKRSVDIACLQMQTAGFEKCITTQPTNLYIGSAQIQTKLWGALLLHAHVGSSIVEITTLTEEDDWS